MAFGPDISTSCERVLSAKSSLILHLPPSCIEICPADPFVFVVGTYNLEKENGEADDGEKDKAHQNRNGSLVAFRLEHDEGKPKELQTISRPSAVLDIHFGPLPQNTKVLGVVSSTGTFSAFRFEPNTAESNYFHEISTSRVEDAQDNIIFLSFAWHPEMNDLIAITLCDGRVCLAKLDATTYSIVGSRDVAVKNELECWCVAFSPSMTAVASMDKDKQVADKQVADGQVVDKKFCTIYAGGDDSAMRYSSLEVKDGPHDLGEWPVTEWTPGSVCGKKGVLHGAGVTAILPTSVVIDNSRVVVTGSYDDMVRVLAIRDPQLESGFEATTSSPRLLAQANLGGGVWRLKMMAKTLVESTENGHRTRITLLVSCMHAGTRLVHVDLASSGEHAELRVVGRFEEHKSMNYGSDFIQKPNGTVSFLSTSFYDRLLCVWDWKE